MDGPSPPPLRPHRRGHLRRKRPRHLPLNSCRGIHIESPSLTTNGQNCSAERGFVKLNRSCGVPPILIDRSMHYESAPPAQRSKRGVAPPPLRYAVQGVRSAAAALASNRCVRRKSCKEVIWKAPIFKPISAL